MYINIFMVFIAFSFYFPLSAYSANDVTNRESKEKIVVNNVSDIRKQPSLYNRLETVFKKNHKDENFKEFLEYANDGDPDAVTSLGYIFYEIEEFSSAEIWLSHGSSKGDKEASAMLLKNYLSGLYKHNSLETIMARMHPQLNDYDIHASNTFLNILAAFNNLGLNTRITQYYWFNTFAKARVFISDTFREPNDYYYSIFNYYENQDLELTLDSSLVKDAKYFYELAEDNDSVQRMNQRLEYISREIMAQKSVLISVCEDIFSRKESDLDLLVRFQKEIFDNPDRAESITKKFYETVYSIYPDVLPISMHFPNISIANILELTLGDNYGIHNLSTLDGDYQYLKSIEVYFYAEKLPSPFISNIVASSIGIDFDCLPNNAFLKKYLDKPMHSKFLSPNIITKWDGDISVDTKGLNGTGVLKISDNFSYKGNIINSMLHDEGGYYKKTKLRENESLVGNGFKEGMLTGNGEQLMDDKIVYVGTFKKNLPHGKGTHVTAEYRYQGEYNQGKLQGNGMIEYIDLINIDPYARLKTRYPIDEKVKVNSYYEGYFINNNPHGAGQCGINLDNHEIISFKCSFNKGNLISIGNINLLPEKIAREIRSESLDQHMATQ